MDFALFIYAICRLGTSKKLSQVNHLEGSITAPQQAKRYLVISSEVDWRDTHNKLLDGKFIVVMMGSSLRMDACIEGKIYLLPAEKASNLNAWNDILKLIHSIDRTAKKKKPVSSLFNMLENQLDQFKDDEFYCISYSLNRSGITCLEYIVTKEHENDLQHIITATRQCYYYLKYSFHVHKHHHKDDDSMTTIHEIPDSNEDIGLVLIEDIKRALVHLNRRISYSDHHALYNAQGVTSYALSLLETCKKQKLIRDHDYEIERRYFENILGSLVSTAGSIERKISAKIVASNSARSAIIMLISIIAPLTIIHKDTIFKSRLNDGIGERNDPSIIVELLSNIFSSDYKFVFFAATIILAYWVYQATHSKFGSFIIAFRNYRYHLQGILGGNRKAKIFAYTSFIAGSFSLLYAWYTAMMS